MCKPDHEMLVEVELHSKFINNDAHIRCNLFTNTRDPRKKDSCNNTKMVLKNRLQVKYNVLNQR